MRSYKNGYSANSLVRQYMPAYYPDTFVCEVTIYG